jgi:mannose-6-phosphate isomerase-like protein (cupin superfamily)
VLDVGHVVHGAYFATMTLVSRSLDTPDETRKFENGHTNIVNLGGGVVVGRATFEPGWRWSNDVKPIAGTDSCQVHHVGYIISGRMHVVMDDGTEGEAGPGDAVVIAPGHDAWIVGDEPCVIVDWAGSDNYAKRG